MINLKRIVTVSTVGILLLFLCTDTRAQRNSVSEIGITGGISYYIGDLNPYKHYYNYKPAFGAFFRHNFNKRIALRLQGVYTNISAFDSESDIESNEIRNLHFRSRIIELGGIVEITFIEYEPGNDRTPGTPYLFAGLTYFRMNPQAEYNDEWVDLQPLATEGQGTSYRTDAKKYKLDQISIPVGAGLKFNIGEKLCLGLEYGIRKTFTDYLDDVSTTYADPDILASEGSQTAVDLADRSLQNAGPNGNTGADRGNSSNKDWYAFTMITLSMKITNNTVCKSAFK